MGLVAGVSQTPCPVCGREHSPAAGRTPAPSAPGFAILAVGPVPSGLRSLVVMQLDRITLDPAVMGGKPCIRGLRVTVGTLLGLMATGVSRERILEAYPYLESADLDAALAYAAWRLEEREETLLSA